MNAVGPLVFLMFLSGAPGGERSGIRSTSGPIDEALVLHYTFDYPDTFGLPGEQRIVRDRSPQGNDGKIVNKPESLPELDGRFGVLRFGGQETYIACGDDDSLFIGGDQTIEMWVRLNSLVGSKSRFAHIYGDANASNFNFGVQNQLFLRLRYTGDEGGMAAGMLIPTGDILGLDWSHIAVVVEYPRCRIYHNGKLVRDAFMPFPGILKYQHTPKYLAGLPNAGSGCPIDLDEFRVYARALDAAEVRAHAMGREIAPDDVAELFVEPHWYEDTVAVRVSCKGSAYRDHSAELTLLDGDYTAAAGPQEVVLKESSASSGRYVGTARFPLHELAGRSLDAVARISAPDRTLKERLNLHISLVKPDWVHTEEGHATDVPAPWTAVEAQANPDGTLGVGVWGRHHVLGPMLLPQAIESDSQPLLTAPIRLHGRVNGQPMAWTDGLLKLGTVGPKKASFASRSENPFAVVGVAADIEFDGYIVYDMAIEAKRDLNIENLQLEIPLQSRFATLCMAMYVYERDMSTERDHVSKAWRCHSGAVNGVLDFRFSPSVWLGNERRGLCWQTESDQYWHNADPQKAIQIVPSGETTMFRANFIDKTTDVSQGQMLHYKFALLATPTRPVLRDSWDLRIVRSDPFGEDLNLPQRKTEGKPTLQYYADMGVRHIYSTAEGDPWPYPMPVSPRYAKGVRQMVQAAHHYGLRIYPYAIHLRFPLAVPEFDIHGLHIARSPFLPFQYGGSAPPPFYIGYHGPPNVVLGASHLQGTVFYCSKSKAAQDAWVHALAQRLQTFGDDGVYLDGSGYIHSPCKNQLHGCGYVADDGTVHPTYPVFGHRELLKRIYVTVKSRRPQGVVDLHHSFGQNTAGLSFADILWTGEHWNHLKHTGAPDGYISGELPLDMFRAEFMGLPIGVPTEMLAYRLMGNQAQAGGRKKVSAISLLHDVPVRARTQDKQWFGFMSKLWKMRDEFQAHEAKKLFYWENQDYVRVGPQKCYATLLAHRENGVLAFISNLSRDQQRVTVEFDLDRLGLQSRPLDVFDVLTDQPVGMSVDGKLSVDLESEDWMYIWLQPKRS